ncbi:cysteine desulfurase family protein [Defluviimonas salinarum]|uniref:Cysteine desulfurase n=1 Tax=Defluviimonas salinarum TaxID=2992147 RepID=A0ABT3IXK7_9RHOB|nr:cysteine desulfurase family protein [Defluviimonas salinarum]MCW3780170.1 cysteine desulfurase [Defluviimonas salinarum]
MSGFQSEGSVTGRVYLDWNASAPLRPEAREALVAALDVVGNPSSVHAEGRAAKAVVERAREQVAVAVGAKPREVVFTSGATEAAGILRQVFPHGAVCVDDIAHDALWSHFDLTHAESGANVLAMGLANSETGAITEPPQRDADGFFPYGARRCSSLLLDVTQVVGRIPWAFAWSEASLAVLSAHKLGGPKGVGALIVREGLDIEPLSLGGGQELGRRSGTENVAGIAGFGAAIEAAMRDLDAGRWRAVAALRDRMEAGIADAAPETIFVGRDGARLPNTACFVTPGWKGETQVMQMDLAGFAVSAGSACSSGKVKASRVLTAMGYDDVAAASGLRVSLGPETRPEDVDRFTEVWAAAHARFRARAA